MVIEACTCNWGIAGVDALPAHTHFDWALVRSPYNDKVIKIPHHDVALNPTWAVLDTGEDVRIWVNWKEVAR